MASTYSQLKLELMVTGENETTWGDKTNANLLALQQAIGGQTAITIPAADYVVPWVDSSAQQEARGFRVVLNGAPGADRKVTFPAIQKLYAMPNITGFTMNVVSGSGADPYSIPNGVTPLLFNDSNGFGDVFNYIQTLQISTTLTVKGAATIFNGLTVDGGLWVRTGGTLTVDVPATFNSSAVFSSAYIGGIAGNSILKLDGAAKVVPATPGTDYAKPDVSSIWTASQSFLTSIYVGGIPTYIAMRIVNGADVGQANGSAISGVYNYDIASQSFIWIYAANTADVTVNIRGSASGSFASFVQPNDIVTVVLAMSIGSPAGKVVNVTVDGHVTNLYWANGVLPAPVPGGMVMYTFAIRQDGGNHNVWASWTQYF